MERQIYGANFDPEGVISMLEQLSLYSGEIPQFIQGPSELQRQIGYVDAGTLVFGMFVTALNPPAGVAVFGTGGAMDLSLRTIDGVQTRNFGEIGRAFGSFGLGGLLGKTALYLQGLPEISASAYQAIRSVSGQYVGYGKAALSTYLQTLSSEFGSRLMGGDDQSE